MCHNIASTYVILISLILCSSINDGLCGDKYILSYSGNLYEIAVDGTHIGDKHKLIISDKIHNLMWPSYSYVDDSIYFEARSNNTYEYGIYKYSTKEKTILEITNEGSQPAISPNGRLLAYYKHPNQLCIYDVITKTVTRHVQGLSNHDPPVWIGDDLIIYKNTNYDLILYNLTDDHHIYTGYSKVTPGAVSRDKQLVLLSSYDGHSIFTYDVRTNTLKEIYKTRFLSMGKSFVWSANNSGFFYARQTLLSQLRLSESTDLFYRELTGKEISIENNVAFSGGYLCTK